MRSTPLPPGSQPESAPSVVAPELEPELSPLELEPPLVVLAPVEDSPPEVATEVEPAELWVTPDEGPGMAVVDWALLLTPVVLDAPEPSQPTLEIGRAKSIPRAEIRKDVTCSRRNR